MKSSVALILSICLFVAAGAVASGTVVYVKVQAPPVPWADSKLAEKLKVRLCQDDAFDVVEVSSRLEQLPPFPTDRCNTENLVNWGQEAGGRYLLLVTVDDERIERRKTFSIPLIMQKYQTVGVVEGNYRLIDVYRGKLLEAKSFRFKLDGPRIFQGSMDDDINDPDIRLNAVEKIQFIGRLEDHVADKLAQRFEQEVRNR